jgi:hypothetical protein
MIEVKADDHVVICNTWGDAKAYHAVRVTGSTVFYMDTYWSKPKESRLRRGDVIFAGPKAIADKLVAQLTSSRAQLAQDEQAAEARKAKRDAAFIAAAMSTLASEESK